MVGETPLMFQVRRSRRRRTIALRVEAGGTVIVHAPSFVWDFLLDRFVRQHQDWILRKVEAMKRWSATRLFPATISAAEETRYRQVTQARLPAAIARYAAALAVTPKSVRVASQRRRWGSCSSRGDLRFSWKCALLPEAVFEYVVVHELAHLKEMNHSPRFWTQVASVCAEYKVHRRWLRQQA